MTLKSIPNHFEHLLAGGCIKPSDIISTSDGFFLIYKSLSDILAEKNILDFPGTDGRRLACNRFFDDWFLYAVPDESEHAYSLLKLREQEHDTEDGSPADGDTPGVTISFISFSCEILLTCLHEPADENRKLLNSEINRVVAYGGQRHHRALKRYFIDPRSLGAYLVATVYAGHIAAFAENGYLETPEEYRKILQQSISYKNSPKATRLPTFMESLNQKAGYPLWDKEKIHIKDPLAPTEYEALAILATHTGNTSVHSFAAEVEYHAKFLTFWARLKLPFLGRSIYDSAIRADMTVGDTEFEGPAPFYQANSKIVRRQRELHPEESILRTLSLIK